MKQWKLMILRKEAGLTQEEFSRLVGIKISPYRNKENGHVEFFLSEMFRIAKFFGKEIDEIFLDPNSTENGFLENESINCGTV